MFDWGNFWMIGLLILKYTIGLIVLFSISWFVVELGLRKYEQDKRKAKSLAAKSGKYIPGKKVG